MEIAWGGVRAVSWLLEDFPLELPQRCCSLIGSMRTGVVMQQQHPFSEAWSLPANGGTKFRQDRAVTGVVTLLEFG